MSFEICDRGHFGSLEGALQEGQAAVQKNGAATLLAEDLELVGIKGEAVVLADPANNRIALRAPNSDDPPTRIYAVRRIKNGDKDTRRVQVNVLQGIRRLKLEPEAIAGRYDCTVTDNLLWWAFGDLTVGERKMAKGIAGKAKSRPADEDEGDD